jgi:hypothetical protein
MVPAGPVRFWHRRIALWIRTLSTCIVLLPPFFGKSLESTVCRKIQRYTGKNSQPRLLVELLELELPSHLIDSLLVINRLGVTGRYPHNLEKMLEQYTELQTRKILGETKEILTWLMQKSSKR